MIVLALVSRHPDEGILKALMPECGHGPVAWHKPNIISERKQFGTDHAQQCCMVATRKIRTSDRALEQHVTDKGKPRIRLKKHHVPGRMTGTMQYIEPQIADLHLVAVIQPAIRRERHCRRKAEQLGLLRQRIQPELFFTLRTDNRNAERIAQFHGRAHMVKMTVGEQHTLQRESALRHLGKQAFGFTTGVDQRGTTGFVPNQRAVLLIRGDREDGKLHTLHYHAMPAFDQKHIQPSVFSPLP